MNLALFLSTVPFVAMVAYEIARTIARKIICKWRAAV